MAGVAVHGCLLRMKFSFQFSMTGNAPSHVHFYRLIYGVHGPDIAVTGSAWYARRDVRGVDKMYIFGLFVYANPGDRFILHVIGTQDLDLRMRDRDVLMTSPAYVLRREICNA